MGFLSIEEVYRKSTFHKSNGHVTDDVARLWHHGVSVRNFEAKYLGNWGR